MVGNWSDKTDTDDIVKVSHLLPAAKSSYCCSLVALWCFCIHTTREGQHEQAAHRTGQSNTNQFIPFLWKTCSHLMFVTVSVLLPFLCLFTHSLLVMCLWYVLVYIALKTVCVCVDVQNKKWDMGTVMWVKFGTLHSEIKVNKGAVNYFIYLMMEKCIWIRGKLTGEGHQHTSSCIG